MIVFAGPGVAGAIRNQFNLVGNTVNSGASAGIEGGGASDGGSTGADSATVQAAVAKDAKDWTLDEQKAVAEDIAAKGEASPAYAKAKAVTKMTDNKADCNYGDPSATTDKAFLLSMAEVYGDIYRGGDQCEYYKSRGVTGSNYSGASSDFGHLTRSVGEFSSTTFDCVASSGYFGSYAKVSGHVCVFPAWCF